MRKNYFLHQAFKLWALLFVCQISAFGQGLSTKGTDFWVGFMKNYVGALPETSVYISAEIATSGTVSIPLNGWTQDFTVGTNATTQIIIPADIAMATGSEVIENKGIHIITEEAVSVYALNFHEETSADASVVFPTQLLGNEYIVADYDVFFWPSEFLIVATENDTEIEILPTAVTSEGAPAGLPFTISLDAGEVYQVQSTTDLSGTKVGLINGSACKNFAVFSGNACTNVGGCMRCDHLYEQMPPVSTWGKEFVTVPLKTREGDIFRIFAAENGTVLTLNSTTSIPLSAGSYYESFWTTPTHIESNHPVMAVQYSRGRLCDTGESIGDPFMLVLNPIEQTIQNATFNAFNFEDIANSYINVLTETSNVSSLFLDGNSVASSFASVVSAPQYSVAQVTISEGEHQLIGEDFIASVYGFSDSPDFGESYGYSIGAEIPNFNSFEISYNGETTFYEDFNAPICLGEPITLTAPLNPNATFWEWNWGDGTTTSGEASTYTYTAADDYFITLTMGIAHSCELAVYDLPVQVVVPVDLSTIETICGGEERTLTAPVGTNFLWNIGITTPTITVSPMITSTYFVNFVDENGCMAYAEWEIQVVVPATSYESRMICEGESIVLEALPLSGGERYEWSTGETTSSITVMPSHTSIYTLTVFDENECYILDSQWTVDVIEQHNLLHDRLICYGESTILSAPIGISYLWDTGETTQEIAVSPASTMEYSVTVTGSDGCVTYIDEWHVEVYDPIATNLNETFTICEEAFPQLLSPGSGFVEYLWSTGGSSESIEVTIFDTYKVTVTNASDCTATFTYIVEEAPQMVLTPGTPNPSTCGSANGSIIGSTVANGQAPFTYQWTDADGMFVGANNADLVDVKGGLYNLQVTDFIGCTANITVPISGYEAPIIHLGTVTPSTCNENNGAVQGISVTEGMGGVNIQWWYQGSEYANELDIDNLAPDTYTLEVTDDIGCQSTTTVVIEDMESPEIMGGVETASTCGNANGSVTEVNIMGGTEPFSYKWFNGTNVQISAGNEIVNVLADTYTLEVTDDNGCKATFIFVVADMPGPVIGTTEIITYAHCGQADGAITNIGITEGTAPLTYEWFEVGSSIPITTTPTLINYSAGGYTLIVTDTNGCTATKDFEIMDSPLMVLSGGDVTEPSCEMPSGSIHNVLLDNGTAPFTYVWTDASGNTIQNEPNLENVGAGTYTLTVTDWYDCVVSMEFELTNQTSPELSDGDITLSTCGHSDGTVKNVVISGGTPPFVTWWFDENAMLVEITDSLVNYPAGTYTLRVTDANGCTDELTFSIVDAESPNISGGSVTGATCEEANGSIVGIQVANGAAPYTFEWLENATGAFAGNNLDLENVKAGQYNFTVTDTDGCTASQSFTINDPGLPLADILIYETTCGQNNGAAQAVVAGGTPDYIYEWKDSTDAIIGTSSELGDLAIGIYTLTVTDENDCMATFEVPIEGPDSLKIESRVVTNSICNFGNGGVTDVVVTGGTPPYVYEWRDIADNLLSNEEEITGLAEGEYMLIVIDSLGCQAEASFEILEAGTPSVSGGVIQNAKCGSNTGSITGLEVTGGTLPYSYFWFNNDGDTIGWELDLEGALHGTYSFQVKDANGCLYSLTKTILLGSTAPVLNGGEIMPSSCGNADGSITAIEFIGENTLIAFEWVDANNDTIASGTALPFDVFDVFAGDYTLIVTDSDSCQVTQTYTILNEEAPQIEGGEVVNATCAGNDGAIVGVAIVEGTPVEFIWQNAALDTLMGDTDIYDLSVGIYTLYVVDENGCQSNTLTFEIQGAAGLQLGETGGVVTDANCGNADGSITDVFVVNGLLPYNYIWSNGQDEIVTDDTQSIELLNLTAGDYTVSITDANGCQLQQTWTVASSGGINIDTTNLQIIGTCFGEANGSIEGLGIDSTFALTSLQWIHNGLLVEAESLDLYNLEGGIYKLKIIDEHGCPTVYQVEIIEAAQFGIFGIDFTKPCGESNGSINDIELLGGFSPFTYEWTFPDGSTSNAALPIADISSGTYSVMVTDSLGCTASISIPIPDTEAPVLSDGMVVNASSETNEDGAILGINVMGGELPLTYYWTQEDGTPIDNDNNLDLIDVPAGGYFVYAEDVNACQSNTLYFPIFVENMTDCTIAADITEIGTSEATCQALGSITGIVVTGIAPITYSWKDTSNVEISTDIDLVAAAGDYTLLATDADSCEIILTMTIPEYVPEIIDSTAIATSASCNEPNGTITVSTQNVETFTWTHIESGEELSNEPDLIGVPSGTIELVVADMHGCTASSTFFIENSESPELSGGTVQNIDCNHLEGMVTDIFLENGTPPFEYLWTDSTGTEVGIAIDLIVLQKGDYQLKVTDANGCTDSLLFTILEILPIAIEDSLKNVTAADCGVANGSIVGIFVVGETEIASQEWTDESGAVVGTELDLIGVVGGDYTLTVEDVNDCVATFSETIPTINGLTIDSLSKISATCLLDNGGVDHVFISGGTAPYTYHWESLVGNPLGTAPTIDNLEAGIYRLIVTDDNGCVDTFVFGISSGSSMALFIDDEGSIEDAACGNNNGGVYGIVIGGGCPTYDYEWTDTNGDIVSINIDLDGVSAGEYTLAVTDADGNFLEKTVLIQNLEITINENGLAIEPPICTASNGGIYGLFAENGTPPYIYLWTDASGNEAGTMSDLEGVSGGAYTLQVTDNLGCTFLKNYEVTPIEENPVITGGIITPADTNGEGGSITDIGVTGGTDPNYEWQDSEGNVVGNDIDLENEDAGEYTLIVTDANGCTVDTTYTIGMETVICDFDLIGGTTIDATCGQANGSIVGSTIDGGTAPFTIQWITTGLFVIGDSALDLVNVPAGPYILQVTDDCGHTEVKVFTILDTESPIINIETLLHTSCGQENASIEISVHSGTPPYTHEWFDELGNPIGGNTTITDLAGGIYTVQVTDADGCTAEMSIPINDSNDLIQLGGSTTHATCNQPNGSIELILVLNALAPLTFEWKDESGMTVGEDANLLNVPAGTYTRILTDDNGCTDSISFTVEAENGANILAGIVQDATVCGGAEGGVVPVIINATDNMMYEWTQDGMVISTTANLSDVPAGVYIFNITDDNGCTDSHTFTVGEVSFEQSLVSMEHPNCEQANGMLEVSLTGGTSPYHYELEGIEILSDDFEGEVLIIENLLASDYTLTITDFSGCVTIKNYTINGTANPEISGGTITPANCGQANGSVTEVGITSEAPIITYIWKNELGSPVGELEPDLIGVPAGNYTLWVTDANGCVTVSDEYTVPDNGVPPQIASDITYQNCAACISVTAVDGAVPFTYEWSTGVTTSQICDLSPGDYYLTITGDDGCTSIESFNLEFEDNIAVDVTVDYSLLCMGDNAALVTLEATSGNTPMEYYIHTTGETLDFVLNYELPADTHLISITDNIGCTLDIEVFIPEPFVEPVLAFATDMIADCNEKILPVNEVYLEEYFLYEWSTGETTPEITVFETGMYSLTVTNTISDCQATGSIYVDIQEFEEDAFFTYTIGCDETETLGNTVEFINETENYDILLWNFGDGNFSSLPNPIHTYTSTGTYTVELLAINDFCLPAYYEETITIELICIDGFVGLDAQSPILKMMPKIYPNPNKGSFYVDFQDSAVLESPYQLTIFNLTGQKVYQAQHTAHKQEVDLEVPSGIYFVQIQYEQERVMQKVVIQ